ncbi:MAG: hypothetical protein KME54_14590 [Tolypothrix brevis GSE-NOS-MK-07-07A]|nr:hypothetical protein [Tolypothrix brevis GSE-NOS-MK-07-07A]
MRYAIINAPYKIRRSYFSPQKSDRTPVKKAIALLPTQKRSPFSRHKSDRPSNIPFRIALPNFPSGSHSLHKSDRPSLSQKAICLQQRFAIAL